jgi:hypothetical protein
MKYLKDFKEDITDFCYCLSAITILIFISYIM